MAILAKSLEQIYTYKEYSNWPEDQRWELIDGKAYNMSPAPSIVHQRISRQLLLAFATYLSNKSCEVFTAPFDVRLPKGSEKDDKIDTVVQPDLVVVCDPNKLDDRGCKGAPDLVIEILSPSTAKKDWKEKFELYERVGVQEYWIVDPYVQTVLVFTSNGDKKYGAPDRYVKPDRIRVGIMDELEIDLQEVFVEEIVE